MKKVQQYSKEWFATNGTKVQNNAIKKLNTKSLAFLILKSNESVFDGNLFVGSKTDIKARYQEMEKDVTNDKAKEQVKLVKVAGGIDAIFNVLDANNDGVISNEELNAAAAVDTPEFAEADKKFSIRDLDQIYENAISSEGAVVNKQGYIDTYKYKDGTTTQIKRDDKGHIYEKYTEQKAANNQKIGRSVYYDNQATCDYVYDNKGRIRSASYDAKGKVNDKKIITEYDDKNNTKKVTTETAGRVIKETYENNVLKESTQSFKYKSDGKIDNTKQQSIGNCWVLAGINSLKETEKGKELIKNSIKQNNDGSITVTLKGVNKTYTFTPDEIGAHDYTDVNKSYSTGDIDMNLFEMAINNHRTDLVKDETKAGKKNLKFATVNDPLEAGYLNEAMEYLTGVKGESKFNAKDCEKLLNKKENKSERYALTTQFKQKDESIGKIVTGHAYSISKVTKDDVYVVNPWDSSVEIKYPKKKFLENVREVSQIDLSKIKK